MQTHKQITSAAYWLCWHQGFTGLDAMHIARVASRNDRRQMAANGVVAWRRQERALNAMIAAAPTHGGSEHE